MRPSGGERKRKSVVVGGRRDPSSPITSAPINIRRGNTWGKQARAAAGAVTARRGETQVEPRQTG